MYVLCVEHLNAPLSKQKTGRLPCHFEQNGFKNDSIEDSLKQKYRMQPLIIANILKYSIVEQSDEA